MRGPLNTASASLFFPPGGGAGSGGGAVPRLSQVDLPAELAPSARLRPAEPPRGASAAVSVFDCVVKLAGLHRRHATSPTVPGAAAEPSLGSARLIYLQSWPRLLVSGWQSRPGAHASAAVSVFDCVVKLGYIDATQRARRCRERRRSRPQAQPGLPGCMIGCVPPACMPPLEGMPGTVPAGRATGGHITLLLCMVGLVHVHAKPYTNA